jgi:formate hydrogenlyase subunit 4
MIGSQQAILCGMAFVASVFLMPILTIGVIRKTKARLQNRIGAPILQPLFDLMRLFTKTETLSSTASWIFRSAAAVNVAVMLILSATVPWLTYKPEVPGADLFLVIYFFALARMFTVLAALDTGSAFGAFGASREVTLALLVEPATVVSLSALAALSQSSDLNLIFASSNRMLEHNPVIWLLVGTSLLLASLVELSRMPVDDPTTHLELTMVHEAMVLEASGRNLALTEYAQGLRMSILFGLVAQCWLRAVPGFWDMSQLVRAVCSVAGILVIALCVGVFESVAVKLQWRKVPEFIAYALTMSFLAALIALSGGLLR